MKQIILPYHILGLANLEKGGEKFCHVIIDDEQKLAEKVETDLAELPDKYTDDGQLLHEFLGIKEIKVVAEKVIDGYGIEEK